MRVIAGCYRGRALTAPKGRGTRPTTDRVKETLMSTLQSAYGSFRETQVLDAFAGSGALGIECLSRGAQTAHFFEKDRAALEALSTNISTLGIPSEKARVFKRDIIKKPPVMGDNPYDLVFLDPPYAYNAKEILALLRSLKDARMLADDAVISYEHDSSLDLASLLNEGVKMDILTRKQFGNTTIDVLTFSNA